MKNAKTLSNQNLKDIFSFSKNKDIEQIDYSQLNDIVSNLSQKILEEKLSYLSDLENISLNIDLNFLSFNDMKKLDANSDFHNYDILEQGHNINLNILPNIKVRNDAEIIFYLLKTELEDVQETDINNIKCFVAICS